MSDLLLSYLILSILFLGIAILVAPTFWKRSKRAKK